MTSGDLRGKVGVAASGALAGFRSFSDDQQLICSNNAEDGDCWQQFHLFPCGSSDTRFNVYSSFSLDVSPAESDGGDAFSHSVSCIDEPLACRLPYPSPSRRSGSPYSNSDESQCSSYSDLSGSSSPIAYASPGPVGSRGRDQARHQWGGRGAETAATCRSKNRGICRQREEITAPTISWNPAPPACRGTKRLLTVPVPPSKFKKQRIMEVTPKIIPTAGPNIPENADGHDFRIKAAVEERRVRLREKRRRRREKNCEKYGDRHRLVFTCAFCKFRTFEDKDIEKHFGSTYHRETLDYIRRHGKFDDRAISFLHDCMVHKFHKTLLALRELRNFSDQKSDQKVMEGVTEDDYMRKVEVVHCVACNAYVPAIVTSVQLHLSTPTHLKNKLVYKEQLKRESVLTAKAIINNDSVKVRYEKYMKGEDPFRSDNRDEGSSDSSEPERPEEPQDELINDSGGND